MASLASPLAGTVWEHCTSRHRVGKREKVDVPLDSLSTQGLPPERGSPAIGDGGHSIPGDVAQGK